MRHAVHYYTIKHTLLFYKWWWYGQYNIYVRCVLMWSEASKICQRYYCRFEKFNCSITWLVCPMNKMWYVKYAEKQGGYYVILALVYLLYLFVLLRKLEWTKSHVLRSVRIIITNLSLLSEYITDSFWRRTGSTDAASMVLIFQKSFYDLGLKNEDFQN